MKRLIITLCSGLVALAVIAVPTVVETWTLESILNSQTLQLKDANNKTQMFHLAGIGTAPDEIKAKQFIQETVGDKKLVCWSIERTYTNTANRRYCIFILDKQRKTDSGAGVVHDYPMLNEDMIRAGVVSFTNDVELGDSFGLKERLKNATKKSLPNQSSEVTPKPGAPQ
jgi:endonuclease YncB( thermonuclease family)